MQATFRRRALINAVVLVVLVSGCTGSTSPAPRDPKRWPFAATSIWNMPIGDRAQFVPAHIEASKRIGNFAEEEVIVLEPRAPMVDLLQSNADWDRSRDRCTPEPSHNVIDRVPIPKDFVTEPKLGATDDNAAAILRADGRTLHQSQPLVRCATGAATTHYRFDDTDLYGDGIAGAHAAADFRHSAARSGFDSYSLAVEWSPSGRLIEEFPRTRNMPFVQEDLTHPWSKDMATIVSHLAVVANNRPDAVGGGGTPRVAMAPPLRDPG